MAVSSLQRVEDRRALSDFVRDRRARIAPEAVGLPAGPRRRTPGLRREEVAQLAGIGVTWYTWFEQGRAIQVSADFLERVCRALRLSEAERAHLYALAQHRPPPHAAPGLPTVSPILQALLDSLPNPAYIKTARWDIVAWNAATTALFGDYALIPPDQRNSLWLIFTDPRYRRMMPDWEEGARRVLAKFRLDHGRAGGDPAFAGLVDRLKAASPEFRRWWPRQDVAERSEGLKRIRHDTLGELEFAHATFLVEGAPDLRLVTYTPVPKG
ncbi:helix-turn-helix transcriptional regulator [Inquilinus limosus]|uniref:helix-turn-helix transcriptional regulator n=1 Tax=Inquilinus limosus TaxID=171674 RepID=UPI000403CD47|nr:helix-turn-helix transcriptional regulator [Inquilinus limosus]